MRIRGILGGPMSAAPAFASMRTAGIVIAGALVLLAAPARAHASVVPITVKSATPADGAVLPPPTASLIFQITSDDPIQSAHVEVATQPTLGQDGTLASEFTVPAAGYLLMTRGDAFPDTYTATYSSYGLTNYGLTVPGTYYWQASYSSVDQMPAPVYSQYNTHTTPVYRFVIAAPTAPPVTPPATPPPPAPRVPYMTLAEANSDVRIAIRHQISRTAYHLKRSCKRSTDAAFDCNVSWGTTARLKRSTVIYAGTLSLEDQGDGTFTYGFTGVRATESCLQRHSVKKCTRGVAW